MNALGPVGASSERGFWGWRQRWPRGTPEGVRRGLDVESHDTEHATYTEENPNSLPAEVASVFLRKLKEQFPQHYAFAFLGFALGLRPSPLRPLRRKGPSADIDWETGRLLVRRSHSLGKDVRNATQQGTRYPITVPKALLHVLKWHVEAQLETEDQRESDLLFPSVTGGFRAGSVLNKPFESVSREMNLGFTLTARGMRRTFQDLARAANVEDIVTRSISGDATERMQQHLLDGSWRRAATGIAKVIDLMTALPRSRVESSGYHSDPETKASEGPQQGASGTPTSRSGPPNKKAG